MTNLAIHFVLLWLSSLSLLSLDGFSQVYVVSIFLILLIINFRINLHSYLLWLLLCYGFVGYLSTTTNFALSKLGIVAVNSWYTYICLLVFSANTLIAYDIKNTRLSKDKIVLLLSLLISTFLLNLFSSRYAEYNDTIKFVNKVFLSFIFLATFFWKIELPPLKSGNHKKLLLISFVIVAFLTNAPQLFGSKKKIAILHSDWCQTDTPYTFKDFTMRTGYSYSIFRELINKKHSVEILDSIDDRIYSFDTLILITPTRPLTNSARKTVLNFVKSGNRLVVISDHTDLYGHARVLNNILEGIGVKFSYDALFGNLDYYKKLKLQHICFNEVRSLTPCSFNTVMPAFVWARARGWISEKGDYSRPNFFGNFTWTSDDKVGNYFVGVTFAYGFGQISVWTDSTIFANFFIFQPRVIDILQVLLEKGAIPAFLAYLFSAFYLALILAKIFNLEISKKSTYILLAFLPLSGITYVIWTQPLAFYPNRKILTIYADKKYITEAPISGTPFYESLSTFYSDLARFDLYPYYSGRTFRPDDNNHLSLFIGTQNDFLDLQGNRNLKAIIVKTDGVFVKKIGMKRRAYHDIENVDISDFTSSQFELNSFFVKGDSIDSKFQGKSFIFSAGIISDQQLGSWWRSYPVSPTKKYYTLAVSNWIKKGIPIKPFSYPPVEIYACENDFWEFKLDGNEKKLLRFCLVKNRYYDRLVYMGHGVWGYANDKDNRLLGGPELTDNVLINNKKWAAKLIKEEK